MTVSTAAIEVMQDLVGETYTRLVPLYFATRDEAYAYLDATALEPSIVLSRGEEVVLYWALADGADPELFPTTSAFPYPMPGAEGWEFASADFAAQVESGTFAVYATDQIVALQEVVVPPAEVEVIDVPFEAAPFVRDETVEDAVLVETPVIAEAAEPEPVPTEDEIPELDEPEPTRFNDAWVHGDIDPELLNRPMIHGYNTDGRQAKDWKNVEVTLLQFLDALTKHEVGAKDGSAILQGSTIDATRKKKAIEAMCFIGVDVDNGTPIERVVTRMKELGWLSILYTTHSHLTTSVARSQDDYVNWAKRSDQPLVPTDASFGAYLQERCGFLPEIAATARYIETVHLVNGLQVCGETAPIPKCRVFLPLAAPYRFADTGKPHTEAMNAWGEKILGLGDILNVHCDASCLDPSRLFYMPRHAEGRPFEIHVVGGPLVSFDEIPSTEKHKRAVVDAYAQAAEEMGAGRGANGLVTAGGVDLLRWSKERGAGFEIAAVFETYASDRIRGSNGPKITCECPFDANHSNPGNPDDQGCFAVNASDNDHGSGFGFHCMHASCREHGKLEMVAEAIRLGWFDESLLTDDAYLSPVIQIPTLVAPDAPPEIDSERSLRLLRDRIAGFGVETSPTDVEKALLTAIQAEATAVQMDDILDRLMKATKVKKGVLEKDIKRIKARIRAGRSEDQQLAALGAKPRPGTTGLLVSGVDEYQLMDRSKELLVDGNRKVPRVFSYNGLPYRCVIQEDTEELQLKSVNDRIITNELMRHVTYFEQKGENSALGVLPPVRMCSLLLEDTDIRLPKLEGFAKMPFLSKEGRLVQVPGYDFGTNYMLHITKGVDVPCVAENPTRRDAEMAHAKIRRTFIDFPFDDGEYNDPEAPGQGSWANFFAALMELFIRPAIPGPTPIFAVIKPSPGTGGTLAVESLVQIATGAKPPILGQMNNDDDIRKMITSVFLRGQTVFVYDNIPDKTPVTCTHWANLATASIWSDRQLGGSDTIEAPNRLLKLFIGNNTRYSHEIARRCAPIRLDAKTSPLERKKRFEIENLEEHIDAEKGNLAACCLTIARYWASVGMPKDMEGPVLASFEGWSRVMGGLMKAIGVPGFLSNVALVQVAANDERLGWEAFISEWYRRTDHHVPINITNPETDDRSLAKLVWQDDGVELPGVYGKTSSQVVSTLKKALVTKIDNVFSVEGPHGQTHQVKVKAQRNMRGGGRSFYLEKVILEDVED